MLVLGPKDYEQLDRLDPTGRRQLYEWLLPRLRHDVFKPVTISVRVPSALAERLDGLSVRRGVTLSDVARAAFGEFIARNPG